MTLVQPALSRGYGLHQKFMVPSNRFPPDEYTEEAGLFDRNLCLVNVSHTFQAWMVVFGKRVVSNGLGKTLLLIALSPQAHCENEVDGDEICSLVSKIYNGCQEGCFLIFLQER